MIARSYILVYRLAGTEIEIVTIRHTAQMWPDRF